MTNYLDKLPEEIIKIIKDYTPRDKDIKAPTSSHIKSLLYYYNYDYERIYNLIDQDELVYFDPREMKDNYFINHNEMKHSTNIH